MLVTPSGISMLVIVSAPLKAFFSITVTLFGMVIFLRLIADLNNASPIFVMLDPSINVISSSPEK